MKKVNFFAPFAKVNKDEQIVEGFASTEAVDSQGEVVKSSALEKALPDYMKFANIREMHQWSAVGKAVDAQISKDGKKGLYLTAKVVDPVAWQKVKDGVYNGFSIGGKVLKRIGNQIEELILNEISLVDRPACPEAVFSMVKISDGIKKKKMKSKQRKKLPDSDFAYIDSDGNRKLPINDEAHVKNAMARFDQTEFESEEKKVAAAKKIIAAAKKLKIEIDPNTAVAQAAGYAPTNKADAPVEATAMEEKPAYSGIKVADQLIAMCTTLTYVKQSLQEYKLPVKHIDEAISALKKAAMFELENEKNAVEKKWREEQAKKQDVVNKVKEIFANKSQNVEANNWTSGYFSDMNKVL